MLRPNATKSWGTKQSITFLALGCLGLAGTQVLAEESVEPLPTTPQTVTQTVSGEKQVIVNEDGSITIIKDGSVTGPNGTRSGTVTHDVNVTPTEDGKTWTRDTTASNDRGGSLNSSTTGSATKTGDGTGTWNSTTDGTVTNANGNSVDYTTTRNGSWEKVDEDTRNFNREAETVRSDGVSSNRSTTGSSTRTEDGRTWESTTTGSNSKGGSWTGETDGSITRNGDGTATLDVDRTVTTKTGDTITIEKDGIVTKDADGSGHSYEGTRTVTKTDVDGDGKIGERPEKPVRDDDQVESASRKASTTATESNDEAASQRKARMEEAQQKRQEKRTTAQEGREVNREGAQENRQGKRSGAQENRKEKRSNAQSNRKSRRQG